MAGTPLYKYSYLAFYYLTPKHRTVPQKLSGINIIAYSERIFVVNGVKPFFLACNVLEEKARVFVLVELLLLVKYCHVRLYLAKSTMFCYGFTCSHKTSIQNLVVSWTFYVVLWCRWYKTIVLSFDVLKTSSVFVIAKLFM